MKILLSSVGRRGYLVRFFKEAIGSQGQIWGGDNSKYTAAFDYCDKKVLLPNVTDPKYVDTLIDFCLENKIDMVVPLIDPELEVMAARRERFYDAGIMAVVSPLETVQIAFDKYLTCKFAKENNIAAPETVVTIEDAKALLSAGKMNWPLVVKPRRGSASSDITYCETEGRLRWAFENCPMPMIQEYIDGKEYGYDLFCDRQYRPVSVFCKLKLMMRAGETDKAVSTDDKTLTAFGKRIAESMRIFGPADVDVMVGTDGPKLLEINPRFGGGYPCSHLAGAAFPQKLIAICRNEPPRSDIGSCPAGVYMLKQDEIISPKPADLDSIKVITEV
jgi:carbamoyl-phosphate synthase large subunit